MASYLIPALVAEFDLRPARTKPPAPDPPLHLAPIDYISSSTLASKHAARDTPGGIIRNWPLIRGEKKKMLK